MGISGLIAGAVQRGQDERREQQLRELAAKLDEEMRRQDMQLRREQVEISRANLDANRIAQEQASALAALKHRDEQAQLATDRNVGMDAANVLDLPGMTDEQKALELQKSVFRNPNAPSAPAMLKMIEGLTRVTPGEFEEYIFTDPKTGFQSKRQYKRGSIPPGGLDMGRQPEGRGTGSAQNYLTLVNQDGKQKRVPDGPEANALFEQGWTIYDPVAARAENRVQDVHPQILRYSEGVIRQIDNLIGREDDPDTPEDESRKNRITPLTTGTIGKLRQYSPFPNEAKNVDAEMFSLASRIAISSLQKMRASSQTGGAVGNVALGEMEIMKNAEAAIRLDQSPENLIKQLGIIRDSEERFLFEVRRIQNSRNPLLNRGITVGTPPPTGGGNSPYQDYLKRRNQGGQ